MANCLKCGTTLPSFTFGETSPYCKTCRAQLPQKPKAEPVDALPSQSIGATRPTPATYILMAINIAIFIAMVASGIHFYRPDTQQVLRWGADYGPYTLGGQYWRLITSMFLHFGILHLFGNMWCLLSLGRLAEKLMGSVAVIGIYLLTGLGASLMSLSWDPMRVSAGASGAVFGIAGALITVLYYGQLHLPREAVRRLLGYVVRFALLNLLFGLQGRIDNMAHLGGLVTGLLIGFFMARTFSSLEEDRPSQRRMILAVSALVLAGIFVPVVKAKQFAVEFGKGKTAFDNKDMKGAIEHLRNYTAARPDDPIGHALLGTSLFAEQSYDEAAQEYERALVILPDYSYVQENLARVYYAQKKLDKSVALFRKVVGKGQADARAYYWYARALQETGDLAGAESNTRNSIRLNPKDADAHRLLAEVLQLEEKDQAAAAEDKLAEELEQSKAAQPSSK